MVNTRMTRRTRRKKQGGTKSKGILKHSPRTAKSRKTVKWHPDVKSPKKPLGRTRSQSRK